MKNHRMRRTIWRITRLVFCCFFCPQINASSFRSSNQFANLQVSKNFTSRNSIVSPQSQAPPILSPLKSNDDDFYYSYRRRSHKKPAHNNAFMIDGVNNKIKSKDECLDQFGRGVLGQLACRGKMSKINKQKMKMEEKDTPRMMMMNGMNKRKTPKASPKKCNNSKGKKSCVESTVPSIVPSSVPQSPSETPMNQSTDVPISKETVLPTFTNVPSISSSPTFSAEPSNDSLPTQYPTFEPTKETPSAPPNSAMPIINLPTESRAPMKKQTQQPTLIPSAIPTVDKTNRPSSIPTQNSNNDLLQRATPFGLTYGNTGNNVSGDNIKSDEITNTTTLTFSSEHIKDVQHTTIEFLEDYLDEQLFGSSETFVDYYVSHVETIDNNTESLPASIVYGFGIVFTNSTTFILSQQEVDVLIESGFRTPFVDVLITTLQQLDPNNPFSSTTSISYTQQSSMNTTKGGRVTDDGYMNTTTPPIKIDEDNSTDIGNNATSSPVRVDDIIQNFDTMKTQYEQATVKVTPFSLTYKWIGHNDSTNVDLDPTIGEFRAASNITLTFLDDYLHTMLDLSQPGAFTYFVGYGAGMVREHNVIQYRTGLHFQDTSMFTSIQKEVNMIIQTAFIPHYVQPLIKELRSQLPRRNPFSNTISITFEFNLPEEPKSNRSLSTLNIIFFVLAILLFIIFAVLILLYRYRRWYRIRRRHRNASGVPKVIVHSNHDPIHGDLIEIISSDDPDENDVETTILHDGFCALFSSVHQRLTSPLATIEDTDEANNDDSTTGSRHYKKTHQYNARFNAKTTYSSDGWSSTSSSTSTLSVIVPIKYTEPRIFEDVD